LPQEGTAQGYYLYGGGGTLPVAIVFILFLCSIVRWSTTIVTFVTIATIVTFIYGVYRVLLLLGNEGCHPYPLLVNGSRRLSAKGGLPQAVACVEIVDSSK